ncbi:hypothetical protein [Neobacillus vireti]|uniref:hypothetical protein n=1 Tax=Neobacillus vireti TaxID=220686 RepID=UPI003000B2A0
MTNYLVSNNTFMVDRIVFTRKFKDLTGYRLKLYLYMCRVVGFNPNGRYFKSYKEASKELNMTESKYKSALKWLESNHFIKKENNKMGRANIYRVMFLPLFDGQTYYSREHIVRDRQILKQGGYGYVEMPIELLQGAILSNHSDWTDLRILTLGLLYLYFWIDVFGGIDPNILHIKNTGKLHIDQSILIDLQTTENRFTNNIAFFEKQGLLTKVKCVYRQNQNAAEYELQYIGDVGKVASQSGDIHYTLFRFTIIPSLKLQNAQIRTNGGLDI